MAPPGGADAEAQAACMEVQRGTAVRGVVQRGRCAAGPRKEGLPGVRPRAPQLPLPHVAPTPPPLAPPACSDPGWARADLSPRAATAAAAAAPAAQPGVPGVRYSADCAAPRCAAPEHGPSVAEQRLALLQGVLHEAQARAALGLPATAADALLAPAGPHGLDRMASGSARSSIDTGVCVRVCVCACVCVCVCACVYACVPLVAGRRGHHSALPAGHTPCPRRGMCPPMRAAPSSHLACVCCVPCSARQL